MKKLFITTLVLGIGFAGISQDKNNKTTTTTPPDTTVNSKANYNTTRSNKKGFAPKKEVKVKTTAKPASGGQAIKPDFQTILERRKMK